ncbi:MAG: hypothetical protein PF447_03330 [Spirochaetaceae bacterium]|jgi:hypothetical protein|nr:hypothetical protein [Spirochaetaceae bacterium]
MHFLSLKKDEQSYNWLILYLEHLSMGNKHCLSLDNKIQCQLLTDYLKQSGLSCDNHSEIHGWIQQNSGEFRSYLNSIKLAALMLLNRGIDHTTLNWEDFCNTEDLLNSLKFHCLDSIY